ncbi:MAG: MFS transporter [Solirubrobacterales bacterium]|nr:MFS transporter [Solirubrobacterales bacterium]
MLLVVCLAQFMVILDVSVVNVALPSIKTGLGFSATDLQWVLNAYTLTFAGFLLLGGRSADLLGRRRVFIAGTALFAISSLACALAESQGALLAARALQGFSGAIVSPATLSIITSSLPEGHERNRGLGAWGAVGGLGASSGALLGGILTQWLGWPAIFAINLPLGALVIALGFRVIPADRLSSAGRRHFDVTGAVLVTAGLVSLTYGIVRTDTLGWGSSGVLLPLALAAVLLAAFVLVEARLSQAPLVPLSIFRLRQLRTANLVVVLMYAALFSMFFFVTLYLQQVLHDDALQAGLSFLPITLSVFTASTLAPRLVERFGLRSVVAGGLLSAMAGLLLLTGVAVDGSYLWPVLPAGIMCGFGMGLGLVASTIAAVQGVPSERSGLASGLLNTSRLFGGALGLAVLSTIATAHSHAAGHVSALQGQTNGFAIAFWVGAAICVVGAFVAAIGLQQPVRPRAVAPRDSRTEAADAEPLAA